MLGATQKNVPPEKKIDVEYYGKKYFVANLCPNQWRKEKVLRATQKNIPPEKRRNSVEHKKKQNNRDWYKFTFCIGAGNLKIA